MNDETKENLNDLFGKFLDSGQVEQTIEDIQKGEQILHEHSAPKPDGELIANIKAEIAVSLLHKKKNTFRRTVYRTAAVAAGFIILAIISVKLFETEKVRPERPVSSSIMPKAVWESERLADDSAESAILVAEVEQIENDLLAMQFGENNGNGREAITELEIETEFMEINSDFWKG
ncbi:MAG: hypothetical protein PHG53_08895 [Phycisphaerae bacterium]|nr:hypothetical protein [Phycisphaerae bacterium]